LHASGKPPQRAGRRRRAGRGRARRRRSALPAQGGCARRGAASPSFS